MILPTVDCFGRAPVKSEYKHALCVKKLIYYSLHSFLFVADSKTEVVFDCTGTAHK
ncbi:hypothetical protein Zm00014a_005874 [Zea mays]|uniref:Uncharacterized protein n=1 Tax=Zea mays TaxID=4577 RepID=A0A3L6F2F4_MAIZE|nr:hypothetical protein Zm00014a_005874 [Zea mays]